MKLSVQHQGGHITESSAFQMLYCLLSFLAIFQCPLMLLSTSDSLIWKEAGRWDEDKTEQQFNGLYDNLALLRLKDFDRGIKFLCRCCGQKRLLYFSVLTHRNQRLLSNIAQVIEQELLYSLGPLQGPYML